MRSFLLSRKAVLALGVGASLPLLFTACGKSSGTAVTVSGFDKLPSASGIVSSSASSSISRGAIGGRFAVTGTAPFYKDLGAHVDQDFFGGLLADINGSSWASYSTAEKQIRANKFWGQTEGGPGGNGACMMAQSVGESLSRILEAGTSACYMKNLPLAATGVTMDPAPADASKIFAQGASDKTFQISMTGAGDGGGGGGMPSKVFIKVFGTSSVGNDYKVQLYFCDAGGSVNGSETYDVNKATGIYTSTSQHTESDGKGISSLSGKIRDAAGGGTEFDPTAARDVSAAFTGSWGSFIGIIKVEDGKLTAKRLSHWSDAGNSGTDKNYSQASFEGQGIDTLKFLEAAFQGVNGGSWGTWSYHGTTSWDTSYYAYETNAFTTDVFAYDMTADPDFSKTVDNPDYTGLDCAASADTKITIDFTAQGPKDVQALCEKDKTALQNWNMCYGTDVQSAQQRVQTVY